ncbi:FtsK-like domain-containing protein [Rubripirellula obstinata]|uniref:FtsK-like domain-containing protein n=1 Tax=Rubripirellula obstinata TaxID=406547 RepID=A0A5B1CN48_9BACT|nr:FtsK/SpoIIIE domain-containing protein [Rubripirellula obstinata]KAA1261976.1 FtsK-like domain-containing protein [Rubripirellula obstinata]
MKDSSVGPTKLLNVDRFGKLLAGMRHRIQATSQRQCELSAKHASQGESLAAKLKQQRDEVMSRCRGQRQEMLHHWDKTEEELTSQYERRAVAGRTELNRMAVVFRRKKTEEIQTIERKVQSRHQAVLHQFENRKNQPGQNQRRETKRIDEALVPIAEHVEWARALTIRRLDGLPEVGEASPEEEDFSEPEPASVKEAVDTIAVLTRKCQQVVDDMQEGAASKIVDSFYLPAAVAGFIVVWAAIALLVVTENRYLWAAAGIIPAGILGFGAYLILLWPLKKTTRELYPKVERIARCADQTAKAGRSISLRVAADASRELVGRRDEHIAAADRWKKEQLAEIEQRFATEEADSRKHLVEVLGIADQDYAQRMKSVTAEMNAKAETLAGQITQTLSQTDSQSNEQLELSASVRSREQQGLQDRLNHGISRGLSRMKVTEQQVESDFPAWSSWLDADTTNATHVDYLPLGSLSIGKDLKGIVAETDSEIPESVPIVLHRRLHSALVIQADEASMNRAIDLAHQVLWRLLAGAAPSKAKLTLIDPLGRGQHFTSFMALADHDPAMIGHRVWTTDAKIEERLAEIASHIEDVLQSSLRDRFERIEDYNQVAGSMSEPYRAIAAVGFPDGLSREGHKHLQAVIDSGLRCGIFTVLVCDSSKPWPSDMPLPSGEKVLSLCVDSENGWRVQVEGVEELVFSPASPPRPPVREALVEKIGTASVKAARVEVPLDTVLSAVPEGQGSTDDAVEIAVGSQGANRLLALKLGEGVKQHVLIAGKTGSGKSTLLHSIITSGAYHYRPDQLHFYLLDFKKGVEFKVYAETGLPHARVIGIESEREFGRSVLQRLDKELQERGEAFRAANVQELDQYRKESDQSMPRIMLVIDEFQELFVRDDRLAGDCSMLLDRLVRQGRSFGIHVVLSSQSLAGAYSLPRATLGQMAVRIAMQCSESDAALVLSDDNTAARLIERPGEAIYNDAGGLVEGNQPFQVAWLSPTRHREILSSITARDQVDAAVMPAAVIFQGNRPCHWTPSLASEAIHDAGSSGALVGLLGESVEIGPPVSLQLTRDTGRNVLLVASTASAVHVMASSVAGMIKTSDGKLSVIHFDGSRADDDAAIGPWMAGVGIQAASISPRDGESEMVRIAELVSKRMESQKDAPEESSSSPTLILIDQLERFRDLRQDESFSFSLDSEAGVSGSAAFQNVLKDGPSVGVFVMASCGGAETFSRWVPRSSQHDFELRVLGQMNANDSSLLIDSPAASDLTAATLLFFDNSNGRITKFRQCELPDAKTVKGWIGDA